MSRLPGVPLDTVRDQLPAPDRDRLAGQLSGRAARPELAALWADQIPRFFDGAGLPSRPPLHTEVMRQHLLDRRRPGRAWRLSGLTVYGYHRDQLGADLRRPATRLGHHAPV